MAKEPEDPEHHVLISYKQSAFFAFLAQRGRMQMAMPDGTAIRSMPKPKKATPLLAGPSNEKRGLGPIIMRKLFIETNGKRPVSAKEMRAAYEQAGLGGSSYSSHLADMKTRHEVTSKDSGQWVCTPAALKKWKEQVKEESNGAS
jgi:hypothetical protein